MKRIAIAVLCLLVPAMVVAQAPVNTLYWDYLAATPAVVATYTQTVSVDGGLVTTAPVCVARGVTDTTCHVPLGALASGPHVVTVTALLNAVQQSATLNNLDLSLGPKPPTVPRVTVTVTITIP
jgi:hypothetical protein